MPDYDFRILSPIDFEMLVRDLIQEELQIRLESFKVGRDEGIDFRYCHSKDHKLIVQAKRYIDSDFRSFFRVLRNDEIPKVKRLEPSRYILATSLGLTPAQKDEIVELYKPFVLGSSDILARDDLNGLLSRYPKVERQHFKLWIASTTVLEEMLNRKVRNASRDELEKIQEHAKHYVQNESFKKALKILDEHNFCIVAGIPGIGKTILAEMLCLYFAKQEYEVVKITGDISEAGGFDYAQDKRLFYYDDFLGQTSLLEKLNKNEDQRLLDFIRAIQRSKISKLVLTTREYILNQARRVYEKLASTRFDLQMFVIDLATYTRKIRAQILYNHLYFAGLPDSFKQEVLASAHYIDVIDHSNYSPRIVQFMTDLDRVDGTDAETYWNTFKRNLDNPKDVWKHAFEEQLSQEARDLLLVMSSLPQEVFREDLEKGFDELHRIEAKIHGRTVNALDFEHAYKESEGTFVVSKRYKDKTLVRFVNPSIKDFLTNYLIEHQKCLIELVDCSLFHEQVSWLWEIYQNNLEAIGPYISTNDVVKRIARRLPITMPGPSCRLVYFKDLDGSMHKEIWPLSFEDKAILVMRIRAVSGDGAIQLIFEQVMDIIEESVKSDRSNLRDLVIFLREAKSRDALFRDKHESFLYNVKEHLSNDIRDLDEYEYCIEFRELFPDMFDASDLDMVRSSFSDFALLFASGYSDPDFIREDADTLRSIGEKLDVDVSEEVERLEKEATEKEEEAASEIKEDYNYSDNDSEFDYFSDEDIKSMFSTMYS